MYKQLSDFTDLNTTNQIYNKLSYDHFLKGLDPTITVNDKFYYPIPTRYSKTISVMPILYFAFRTIGYNFKRHKEYFAYAKKTLLELYQNKKISKEQIENMATCLMQDKNHFYIVDFFIKEKLLDVNLVTKDGYNLLCMTDNKSVIDKLIGYGCDLEFKILDKDFKFYDKKMYEIAFENKLKGLMKAYEPYIEDKFLKENLEKTCQSFRQATKITQKIKIYKIALKENNLSIIKEITNNQDKYKDLITYNGAYDEDLITYAFKQSNLDYLKELINIAHYANNKNKKDKNGACYTRRALNMNKTVAARFLYEHGFGDKNDIKNLLIDTYYSNTTVFNMLLDEGQKFSLSSRIQHNSNYKLEQENLTKERVIEFFADKNYLLDLSGITEHYGMMLVPIGPHKQYDRERLKICHVKLVCYLLKQEEILDPENFKVHFEMIAKSMSDNSEEIGLRLCTLLLNAFPEKEKEMIDLFSSSGKKEWLTKFKKENLENLLKNIKDDEEKPAKRMKI